MNRALKKVSAMLMSVMLALTSVPYSYAATVDSGSETSYSVQNKAKTIAKVPASGGDSYAAVLRADKVANDAQTKPVDGYLQQVETKLSEATGDLSATYFEQDKYLSDPTGEKNGQSTYNVTLENAYVGAKIENVAPDGQDIIIIEDASSSMKGYVDQGNQAYASLIRKIQSINLQRVDQAVKGAYSDIKAEGKTRNEIQQEMIDKNHLLRLVGIESFNSSTTLRSNTKTYLLSDADVNSAIASAKLSISDLNDLTRTDYAIQDISGKYGLISDASKTSVVLITDGAPYDWNNSVSNGYLMSSAATNNALNTANSLKARGVHIFVSYVPWDSGIDISAYNEAVRQGSIDVLAPGGKIARDSNYAAIFASLLSSDYATGHFGVKSGSSMFDDTISYTSNGNGYGKYSKVIWDADSLGDSMGAIATTVNAYTIQSALIKAQYASYTSYIVDDISHPFELDGDISDIKVYQVPRVPKNLDAAKHPTDADANGFVSSFTWGTREDITDQVEISYENNRIKVTGYNYEANALTNYDHDLALTDDQKPADPTQYKAGDYGYKLVVEFPIRAKYTFGGNDIETNDSTTSGFYPSAPGSETIKKYPEWIRNSTLNPNGNSYVALYPVPIVDLKVNYALAYDSTIIYAPQTEKLRDLVTNASDDPDALYIFNVGDVQQYHSLYRAYTGAVDNVAAKKAEYEKIFKKFNADGSAENFAALDKAGQNVSKAVQAEEKALTALRNQQNYVPNGENNAYVNITYTLTSPSGKVIGTMNIPHGTDASDNATGSGKVHWDFTDGADAEITESGEYKITATVTPVKTTREESYTGSSDADETCSAKTYTANPTAYIYVLQVKVKDTTKRPGASLDFGETGYDLFDAAKSNDWKDVHFVETKWVPLNGKTPESDPSNEPGAQSLTESNARKLAAGKAPTGTVSIANTENVSGTETKYVSKSAKDGTYIPAAIEIHRMTGDLNKFTEEADKKNLQDHALSDEDHLYGDKSSVVWVHECESVDDCDNNEFADAHNKNDGGKTTGLNITRFLVHVSNMYLPDVRKKTSTPSILPGQDISWSVTVHNDNAGENKEHKTTKAQMLDVLPYSNDGRTNPNDNTDTGSSFGGDLYFKTISVDCTSAQAMKDLYAAGSAKFYYTEDTAVRTASREDWYDGNIAWTAVTPSVNGNTVSFTVPKSAVAIKSDTTLAWNEQLVFDMTANVKNLNDQKAHDTYINKAVVGNSDEVKDSDPVVTVVTTLAISGTIWYDDNQSGQMDESETKAQGLSVSLYREKTNESTEGVTLGGTNLEKVYNSKEELVSSYITDETGYYEFECLNPGTYYVVATEISADYKVTAKQAAGTDDALNSKAEETMPTGQTAWITKIVVSDKSVEHQNIGLVIQKGTLTIQKAMENGELYYPSSMTDEQKKDLVKGFIFKLTNNATGEEYTSTLHMDIEHTDGVSAVIEDLPLGTYTLKEESSLGYDILSMTGKEGNFSYNEADKTATIVISPDNTQVRALVVNKIKEPTPGVYPGESVANHIGTSKPINFAVEYAHGDINDTSAVSYTFKESDFANMTVWYDDGSYRDFTGMYKQDADGAITKLSEDRLKFSEVTLSPATITNERNTTDSGNQVDVKVYYTERGKILSDKFSVGVNLAPIYKFTVVFHANGSTIGGTDTNEVRLMYNDAKGANDIISGVYRQPDAHEGWNFAGWNTASDGSGINYGSLTALNELGAAKSGTNRIDLYAHWTTAVTFNANGGNTYLNGTQVENPYIMQWDVHRKINSAGMTAGVPSSGGVTYSFLGWYTAATGGTTIDQYGIIEGPTTFYASYVQNAVFTSAGLHTFNVALTGTYKLTAYGAGGAGGKRYSGNGATSPGGGGTTTAYVHLDRGQTIYAGVGQWGYTGGYDWRWNGGGSAWGTGDRYSGNGGGATHFALTKRGDGQLSNYSSYRSEVILVAGGGGGGGEHNNGQNGNGSGGAGFGSGGGVRSGNASGGGGGWSGGRSGDGGGGGTGYLNPDLTTNGSMVSGGGGGGGSAYIEYVPK